MQLSIVLFAAAVLAVAHTAHNLEEEYNYHRALDSSSQYMIYWRFNMESKTINFAVNVSTRGWIGFGISPNGKMPGSDVVMGWVDDNTGASHFNDRYAAVRGLPSIDSQQNWFLTRAEQEDGHTLLEFYRNFTSCDDQDLDISSGTTRVIWSWHSNDPVQGIFQRHEEMGTTSLSLLGNLPSPRSVPGDSAELSISVKNVTIPHHTDTTYWCQTKRGSDFSVNQTIYIYKIAPDIDASTKQHVHHIVIYLCGTDITEDYNTDCDSTGTNRQKLRSCYFGEVIAAWAVGGEDFYFPENVSLPFDTSRTLLMEMHYDNPQLQSGRIDSSGIKLSYSLTPSKYQAASLSIGSTALPALIIPPNADNFTYDALCSSTCLDKFLPKDGIQIFGSLLHTHLTGKGLVVRHIRNNNSQCGATEELAPVDKDLLYDFNYQQINHLPQNVHLKRGDSLVLQCIYQTKNKRNGVTLGGLGTRNEMCTAFLYYYPKMNVPFCGHHINHSLAYDNFITEHLGHNVTASLLAKNSLNNYDTAGISETFNQIQWTDETINQFEGVVRNAEHNQICLGNNNSFSIYSEHLPSIDCTYEAYNQCTGYRPRSCCERLRSAQVPSSAAGTTIYGLSIIITLMVAMLVM